MGRCNNRRTQQAAAEARNTPARARFSKVPTTTRNNKKKGGGRGAGNGNKSTTTPQEQQRRHNVVRKISSRVVERQQQTGGRTAHAKTSQRSPLAGVNLHKLDKLTLPPESVALITRLLQDLNVVLVDKETEQEEVLSTIEDDEDHDPAGGDDGADDNLATRSRRPPPAAAAGCAATAGGYTEYEDDGEEPYYYNNDASQHHRQNGAGLLEDDHEPEWQRANDDDDDDAGCGDGGKPPEKTSESVVVVFRNDPVFLYLTRKLSFTEAQAGRACGAVETWSPAQQPQQQPMASSSSTTEEEKERRNNNNIATPATAKTESTNQRLSHVMDWLCLHLSETELERGFLPSSNTQTAPGNDEPAGGRPLSLRVGTGRTKAIPHPSISVVTTKLTDDVEWKRRTRLEERAVRFLKLGFTHAEIVRTLEETDPESTYNSCEALDDTATLRVLLAGLEREALSLLADDDDNIAVDTPAETQDDEQCEFDREQEREALSAIYENHFVVLEAKEQGSGSSEIAGQRYRISFEPAESLEGSANSDVCDLHVFLRNGYPSCSTPLLLLHNPTLPWPLLRRINVEMMRQAAENIGGPSIFESVSNISERLPDMLSDYNKEQRAKEFEETQRRLRHEAGHDMEEDSFETTEGASLGRRQRAKLKGAEKAFDRGENEKQDEARRRKLQEDRIQRAKDEDKSIRQSFAEQAVLQREKQRQEEELREVSRSAMSASFNRGESVEEARAAAKKAEQKYRREHGMDLTDDQTGDSGSEDEEDQDDDVDSAEDRSEGPASMATPHTLAFMDRLRSMYSDAANQKGGYRLNDPAEDDDNPSDDESAEHAWRPCPIAAPVGDLAKILEEDVLAVQEQQPWLVAPEARVPHSSSHTSIEHCSEPSEISQLQREISDKLQKELSLSLKKPSKKVQEIRRQNCQLPAFEMREHIVSTVRASQVTLISASTGRLT